MDRKWRTNRGAVDTVQPLPTFRASLGFWKSEYQLATLTDLYAAYTVLHIEDKECTLMWSEEAGFYYFLTRQTIDGESPSVAAPEGDEDPPLADLELIDSRVARQGPEQQQLRRQPARKLSGILAPSTDTAENAGAATVRTQVVVPISSCCGQITPALFQRLFSLRGVQAQAMVLGLVDSHGVVSRSSLYNYIQAPLEGPGTANLDVLDD